MHLSESTWTEVRDADADVALLAVGSTEQHGPHAPLGVDCLTAEAIAGAGADRYESTGGTALVGPTIPVGVAEEHRAFEGTLWVSPGTFRAYVRETIESLPVDPVVVVNGHGGNVAALRECCGAVSRDGDAYAVSYTWFDAVDLEEVGTEMGHGGPAETSLIRHLRPELIREDRTAEAAAGAASGWGEWTSGTNLAYDSNEFTDSGVVGDPREGDAELGDAIFEASAAALAELLEAVVRRSDD